ncbi:nucleotidyl transferase AbiEii/AbiGii toxin family protein [soil metagenome]
MTRGEEILRRARALARGNDLSTAFAGSTDDYLTRHALESFLDRLANSRYRELFILKGGLAVSVYNVRRPTKDIDSVVVDAPLDAEHLRMVVQAITRAEADDGLELDVSSIDIQEIREGAEYPGIRVRVRGLIATAKVVIVWDVSTGDPITPAPRPLTIERVLGGTVTVLGYSPETIIAEKAVTILERGVTSTRWRDYVDIVQLAENNLLSIVDLTQAAQAVAQYRSVTLGPTAPVVAGYGSIAQPKWAAWRRKHHLEDISEELLDDQMTRVAALIDPIFTQD